VAEQPAACADNDDDDNGGGSPQRRLYLLTHGVALAKPIVLDKAHKTNTAFGDKQWLLSHVIVWTNIHHLTPLLEMNSIAIHLRDSKQYRSPIVLLCSSSDELSRWMEALQVMLVQNTLHSQRPHVDVGWQYSLVYVSWFTLAVCGYDDDMARGRDFLNHLDDYHRYAPLHYAIHRNNVSVVKVLLEAGADPNLLNGDHQSPLRLALDGEYDDIAQLLREHGAKEEK
jgi:hypothetical protein